MVWPAVYRGWEYAFGVLFFIVGMFLMFLASTIYHWVPQEHTTAKGVLRRLDHISIYVMIACSYTPICVSVIGGWLGWLVFGLQWAVVIGGVFYKVFAMGRYPRLSLALYLIMGWSVVLIIRPVILSLSTPAMLCIVGEGLLYTVGTYFFAHDDKKYYHGVWHIFVLLGAMAHWTAVLLIIL
jgi:hemolysin III